MNGPRIGVLIAFLLVLGVPFFFRPPIAEKPAGARTLIIITPHNEQIRYEFERAFNEWHQESFGSPVVIDWRQPGGTSEIRKQLDAVYSQAIVNGQIRPDGSVDREAFGPMPFDLFFGGGSYDHSLIKRGVTARPRGAEEPITIPMSVSAEFTQDQLNAWFGDNAIGSGLLYDPEQYWIGTALSGFGIVYNRDVLEMLELPEPTTWTDLVDARYTGWLAMGDPRMSGSVTTTYDSILNNYGWDEGWRLLRDMSANARYFADNAAKIPPDVSQGEAAAGVSIDFYGRYQAQAVMQPGETSETSRVGYVDPPGVVFIDADPITLMRGAPSPELARRFIAFCLTEQAQALWQFHARGEQAGMGPHRYELRRMPVRRVMYEKYIDQFIDRVNAFRIASTNDSSGWRSSIEPLMSTFGIDIHHDLVKAWKALNRARASAMPEAELLELEELFYAMPWHPMADGRIVEFNEKNYRTIREDWRAAEKDGRWDEIRIEYTRFFRENYREIVSRVERSADIG